MLIELLRNRIAHPLNDEVYDMAVERLEDLLKDNNDLKNDWHQPELCNEKYNNLLIECNQWEELCDAMYDIYDCDPKVEINYLRLKGMHKNEE